MKAKLIGAVVVKILLSTGFKRATQQGLWALALGALAFTLIAGKMAAAAEPALGAAGEAKGLAVAVGKAQASSKPAIQARASSLYGISIHNAKGEKMTLEQYKGKPILLVNIATRCGYTPQLKGLEALHSRYSAQGLVILGVPSNDFGAQTPEANPEVLSFCQSEYGVSFPVLEKVVVKGQDKHPLFQQVIAQDPGQAEIKWNFEKFLIGPDGRLVKRFLSAVEPESAELTSAIEALFK